MAAPKKVTFVIAARDLTTRVFRRVGRRMRGLSRAASRLTARMATLGALGFAAAAVAAAKLSSSMLETARSLDINVELWQQFSNVVEEAGGNASAARTVFQRLTTNLGDARRGVQAMQAHFLRLGFTMEEIENLSPEDALGRMLELASAINDPALRNASIRPIIDTEGVDSFNRILAQGITNLAELQTAGGKLGVVPEATLKKLEKATDLWRELWGAIKPAVFDKLATAIETMAHHVPSMVVAIDSFIEFVKSIPRFRQAASGFTVGAAESTRESFAGRTSVGGVPAALPPFLILRLVQELVTSSKNTERNTRGGGSVGE